MIAYSTNSSISGLFLPSVGAATMNDKIPFFEDVKERFGNHIIRSDCRPATHKEIKEAEVLHSQGKCPHYIIYGEPGYLCGVGFCYTCDKILGTI